MLNYYLFLLNLGVLELGFTDGSLIFINKGIGKSTPTSNASPSPSIGKKDKLFLLADETAFSIAFLSCSLIKR